MKITGADYKPGLLMLRTNDPEAYRFAIRFDAGDYQIEKRKKRRSLDANAYAWVLMDKLAAATGIPKNEIYMNTIRQMGGNSKIVHVPEDDAEDLIRYWSSRGLGWQGEIIPSAEDGFVNVILYYGSSEYDTQQMSRLIDSLVQDCKALEIETMPPDKLAALLEAWK